MKTWMCIAAGVVTVGLAGTATVSAQVAMPQSAAQLTEQARELAREASRGDRQLRSSSKEQQLYSAATSAMDAGQWGRALELFTEAAALKGDRQDGALYWKAYVQNKLGQRPEALATIQELLKAQPSSRWVSDAKALDIEVRNASGQPVKPEAESDDDLKLLALNGLMNNDAEQAIAILQKLLQGPQSRKVKQRALFVLSQNRSPKAREVLVSIAKGAANPDLQRDALNYLGISRSKENTQVLAEIYASKADADVKRKILQSFMMAGERDQLLAAARTETDASLRVEAIRGLGMLHASDSLSQLYAAEASAEVKKELMRALMQTGDTADISKIATTEPDAKLKVEAIRMLGVMGKGKTSTALAELYAAPSQSIEARKAVIGALFMQGDAKTLVDLARKETNPELRKQLVQQLSMMKSKEATDFLMELINK